MKKNYNTEEIFELLTNFIRKYKNHYPETVIQTLQYKLALFDLDPDICGGMNQIYDELGILEPNDNFYLAFAKILEKNFSLDRHVIEIGSGEFPTLGKQIAQMQAKLKTGTLTIYDPNLIPKHRTGMELKKRPFTEQEPITGEELLIGFFPCEALQTIIKTSLLYDLDFSVQLCGCLHDPNFKTQEAYHHALIQTIQNKIPENRKLKIEYLDPHYQISYPIISSMKVKKM